MTTFAEQIEALPKMPKTLADVPDGSFGGFLITERNALEARLRLAVELLGCICCNARVMPDPAMQGATDIYAVPLGDIAAARALVGKIKGELV